GHELGRVIHVDADPGIGEMAVSVHLRDRDIVIPVGYDAVPGIDLASDVTESEGRWNYDRMILAVDVETRIVFAGTPRVIDLFLWWSRHVRERDDRADVEIAIGPPIQTMADSRSERVIDGGVTERASNSDASECIGCVDLAHHAHHGPELEQRDGGGG